jgi:Na+-transporting methylmalonyl-CoA/oxaloacetate decarboxylase gamma subunit
MRRSIAIAVALVLIVVGLLGFATGAFVAIGCVVLVLSSLLLAVMLGIGASEDEGRPTAKKPPERPKNNRPNVS